MHSSAIIGWLKEELSKRFQQKESENLTTLVWFDPNRYWLQSLPRLIEESAAWTVSPINGIQVPMQIVAVGPDISDGNGESPLQARLAILTDRARHRARNGLVNWSKVKRWVRTAFPHSKVSDRVIRSGDLVMIDTGASYGEYICDLTRTFAVDKVEDEFRKVFDIVREANAAVEKNAKPGMTAEEVDRLARDVIESKGYGKQFIHRLGHGLGLEGHEPPYMVRGNRLKLLPGMTFTDEPGVYLTGRGGIRIEDDVVVTESGLDYLTGFSRELMVLD